MSVSNQFAAWFTQMFAEQSKLTRSNSVDSVSTIASTKHSENGESVVSTKSMFSTRKMVLAMVAMSVWWAWSKYIRRVIRRPQNWGPDKRVIESAAIFTWLMGIGGTPCFSQLADMKQEKSVPQKQVLGCFHPHGSLLLGSIINIAGQSRNPDGRFNGIFMGAADALFQIPVLREFSLLYNTRPASSDFIDATLTAGKSIAISPGGIHEMLATDPSCERVFFPPNLGFVRKAMKFGVPLLPMYTFGENQIFDVPEWSRVPSTLFRKLTSLGRAKHKGAGVPLPIGRWGIPGVPKKLPTGVSTYVGNEIEVGPPNLNPTDAEVKEIFFKYLVELYQLFEAHAQTCLPAEVAAKGLIVIWRGYESENMSKHAIHLALATHFQGELLPPSTQASGVQFEKLAINSRL